MEIWVFIIILILILAMVIEVIIYVTYLHRNSMCTTNLNTWCYTDWTCREDTGKTDNPQFYYPLATSYMKMLYAGRIENFTSTGTDESNFKPCVCPIIYYNDIQYSEIKPQPSSKVVSGIVTACTDDVNLNPNINSQINSTGTCGLCPATVCDEMRITQGSPTDPSVPGKVDASIYGEGGNLPKLWNMEGYYYPGDEDDPTIGKVSKYGKFKTLPIYFASTVYKLRDPNINPTVKAVENAPTTGKTSDILPINDTDNGEYFYL